jgi:hypothetical protein
MAASPTEAPAAKTATNGTAAGKLTEPDPGAAAGRQAAVDEGLAGGQPANAPAAAKTPGGAATPGDAPDSARGSGRPGAGSVSAGAARPRASTISCEDELLAVSKAKDQAAALAQQGYTHYYTNGSEQRWINPEAGRVITLKGNKPVRLSASGNGGVRYTIKSNGIVEVEPKVAHKFKELSRAETNYLDFEQHRELRDLINSGRGEADLHKQLLEQGWLHQYQIGQGDTYAQSYKGMYIVIDEDGKIIATAGRNLDLVAYGPDYKEPF